MNPRNNKAEWFRYAKMYARAAGFLMEKTPPVHNTVCYLSFLSAECSMKGFLLQNHLRPVPDTHDLRELCQLCASFQAGYLELEDDCDFLTQFATPSGFPPLNGPRRRTQSRHWTLSRESWNWANLRNRTRGLP